MRTRRRFSAEFNARTALEAIKGHEAVASKREEIGGVIQPRIHFS